MCLYPKLVRNPKYRMNKKNGGDVPAVSDNRVLWVPVGCGQCIQCRRQKANEWKVRILEEIKDKRKCNFVTLTFSPESLEKLLKRFQVKNECSAIAGKAIRLFLERYRKKYKRSIKHWFITELGEEESERLHIHGLMWEIPDDKEIEELWGYGNVVIDKRAVTTKTVNYCVKYMVKIDHKHKNFRNQIFCSAGIGKGYLGRYNSSLNIFRGSETDESYVLPNGSRVALPIYYRNKIYSDEEREQLWLNKLDKNERWVNGIKVKIDTEEGLNHYYTLLANAQEYNKQAGYGDDSKEWKKKEYNITYKMLLKKEKLKKVLEDEKKLLSLQHKKRKK